MNAFHLSVFIHLFSFYNNNFLWGIILRLNWSLIPLDDVVSIVCRCGYYRYSLFHRQVYFLSYPSCFTVVLMYYCIVLLLYIHCRLCRMPSNLLIKFSYSYLIHWIAQIFTQICQKLWGESVCTAATPYLYHLLLTS